MKLKKTSFYLIPDRGLFMREESLLPVSKP